MQVENTSKDRSSQPEDRRAIVNHVHALEIRLRTQLQEFVQDEQATELELEPMDKDLRFICHDVVQDFVGLVSASAGEDEQR